MSREGALRRLYAPASILYVDGISADIYVEDEHAVFVRYCLLIRRMPRRFAHGSSRSPNDSSSPAEGVASGDQDKRCRWPANVRTSRGSSQADVCRETVGANMWVAVGSCIAARDVRR